MTGLILNDLQVHLNGRKLVQLSCHLRPGQVLTVMGESGSGKSTLLSALIGALPPQFVISGTVTLNNRVLNGLATQERRLGILFQDNLLFPHMSVAQNLGFGMAAGVVDRNKRISDALDSAGLRDFGPRDPATLSGGQKARVALLRTLLAEPEALLLDEPFSRLDTALRAQIRSFVFEQAQFRQLPVILVTHDDADALAAGGDVISTLGEKVHVPQR